MYRSSIIPRYDPFEWFNLVSDRAYSAIKGDIVYLDPPRRKRRISNDTEDRHRLGMVSYLTIKMPL
jgi:hypothetical protein